MDDLRIRAVDQAFAAERQRVGSPVGAVALPDLPVARYTDPEFHAAEISHVFGRSWLFVGHESEWLGVGGYRVVDTPMGEVVVVRGTDGELRAFRNACRHRGAPVCREAAGIARRFVCQFHSWSYALDGTLAAVPLERDFVGLDREERGLVPVGLGTHLGFVFVTFDDDPMPLEEDLAAITERYADLLDRPVRLAHHHTYHLDANWKIVAEAFLETYHIRTVHQATAGPITDTPATVDELFPRGHSTSYVPWVPEAFESAELAFIWDLMFPDDIEPVGDVDDFYHRNTTVFSVFPNLVAPIDDHGLIMLGFWPEGIDRTRLELHWYGADWGDGARPAGWDARVAGWDAILAEDLVNIGPIQRSVATAAHEGVPLGCKERRLYHLHAEIDRRIGTVPPELAVPDVLGAEVTT